MLRDFPPKRTARNDLEGYDIPDLVKTEYRYGVIVLVADGFLDKAHVKHSYSAVANPGSAAMYYRSMK
jgi:hypothetical protein